MIKQEQNQVRVFNIFQLKAAPITVQARDAMAERVTLGT